MPSLGRPLKHQSVLDFNRKAMDLLGLWPIDPLISKSGQNWRRFFPIFVLCRVVFILLCEAMSVKQVWGDTYLTAEFTIMFIMYIHAGVKFFTLYWHRARVRCMLARVDQLNVDLVGVSQRNVAILRNTDNISNFINKYPPGVIVSGMVVCTCILIPYAFSKREVLFMLWFPHDVTVSPSYEITATVVSVGILIDLLTVVVSDLCFITPILQIAGQLQMLRHRDWVDKYLGDIVKKPDVVVGTEESKCCLEDNEASRDLQKERLASKRVEEQTTRMMNELIGINANHHQQLIQLVQEIQSIFNVVLAEQIVFNGLLGLVGLYVSTLSKKTDPKVIMMSALIMAGVSEFFFFCLCCDRLTIASMQLFNSAYECDWLEASEPFKRSLRLLMTRAQKHLAIKAAGVPLSRRTFRSVCKGGYYLQSLLDKMYTRA